jgi:insertion element IS1 protein InsB
VDKDSICVEVIFWEEWDSPEAAELDEMWSFVRTKKNQRWLWLAIDHNTKAVLAFTFGRRKDAVFKELKALLEPFGISMFYTDDWGSYGRNLEPQKQIVGKENTQEKKKKNLTLRTRIKRLCRKTICFSKCVKMHDIVIGLVINILEFGWCVYSWIHTCRT